MALLRYADQEAKNIAKARATAQQQAKLDAFLAARKAAASVTKQSLGLENVNNTSDASKPISTATQTALNGKAALVHPHAINDVTGLSSALSGLSDAAAAKLSIPAITTISTDAAATISPTTTNTVAFHTGALTANRAITLSTAGVATGSVIRIVRTGSGAFNLSVGGLKSLATSTWCDVIFTGSAWALTAYGTL